jgi:murein DD-endopeptidase MepM/ murein hydrolase activator NlpD
MNGTPDPTGLPAPVCDLDASPNIDCVADEGYAMFFARDGSGDAVANTPVAFASRAFTHADAASAGREGVPRPLTAEGATAEQPSTDIPDATTVSLDGVFLVPMHCVRTAAPAPASRWPFSAKRRRAPDGMVSDCGASLTPPDDEVPATEAREVVRRIRRGETLGTVLGLAGVSAAEIHEWVRATRRVYNLNRIYVGQALTFSFDGVSGGLRTLALEIDARTRLVARRNDDGVVAGEEPIPHARRLRIVGGEITGNLYTTATLLKIPDRVISDTAEILGWELDLGSAVRRGASFRVVYEELVRVDTGAATPARVLAVELVNQGQEYEGYYFTGADGSNRGYYNRKGEALGRAFLRYPVRYSRISSSFSRSRFHPVLRRRRPHNGVDFAARRGTPVEAVADGRVTKAGWFGGYGRFVKLRHDTKYGSGYAHLSRIAPGLRPGVSVKKGQVIGYVGSTGLATGAHLHFEMYNHGAYIDPLTANLPRGRALGGKQLTAFKQAVGLLEQASTQVTDEYARVQEESLTTPGHVARAADGL